MGMNLPVTPTVSLATMPAIDPGVGERSMRLRALGASILGGLGAGHRSLLPLAIETWQRPRRGRFLRLAVTALAIGELVADKLPMMPDRRRSLALAGRIVTGALVGSQAASRGKSRLDRMLFGFVGATAAVVATFVGARLRRKLDRRLERPAGAFVEDAIALGVSWAAAKVRVR